MSSMHRCVTLLLVVILFICGCDSGNVRGVSSGGNSWTVVDDNPIPGIHKGAAEVITLKLGSPKGVTLVVWCAGASGVSSQSSAEPDRAYAKGHFHLPDEAQVEFQCTTIDGMTAKATIAGNTYDSSDGSLFLVSPQPKAANVKQLNVNVSAFPKGAVAIKDFALGNPEIAEFFKSAQKDAAVDPEKK